MKMTPDRVKMQIIGLKRTQAAQVTVRKDVLEYALGSVETAKLALASVSLGSRKPKFNNLLEAKKDLEMYGPTASMSLITVDRESALEALLGAMEQGLYKAPLSPPQKDGRVPAEKLGGPLNE